MGCGSSSGSPTPTSGNTTTTTSGPPQAILDQYSSLLNRATGNANTPLTQYSGPMVAGFTQPQMQAFNTIQNSQGVWAPYVNAASQYAAQGANPITPQQFSAGAVDQYMSPYTNDVVNSTLANFDHDTAVQNNDLIGKAIGSGAFGGDRAGVASAEGLRQRDLARGQLEAGLRNQAYQQGLGEFNTQQQVGVGAQEAGSWLAQNAGAQFGALGREAQLGAQQDASSLLQAGGLQQQLGQEELNIPYEQFLQQQAYPFQTTGWLGSLVEGLGGASGGTSSTTVPSPSTTSQLAGLGLGGLALIGGTGGFGSNGWLQSLWGGQRGGRVPGYAEGGGIDLSLSDQTLPGGPVIRSPVPGSPSFRSAGQRIPAPPHAEQEKSLYDMVMSPTGLSALSMLGRGRTTPPPANGWRSGSANALGPDSYGPAWGPGAASLSGGTGELPEDLLGSGWASGSANALGADSYGGWARGGRPGFAGGGALDGYTLSSRGVPIPVLRTGPSPISGFDVPAPLIGTNTPVPPSGPGLNVNPLWTWSPPPPGSGPGVAPGPTPSASGTTPSASGNPATSTLSGTGTLSGPGAFGGGSDGGGNGADTGASGIGGGNTSGGFGGSLGGLGSMGVGTAGGTNNSTSQIGTALGSLAGLGLGGIGGTIGGLAGGTLGSMATTAQQGLSPSFSSSLNQAFGNTLIGRGLSTLGLADFNDQNTTDINAALGDLSSKGFDATVGATNAVADQAAAANAAALGNQPGATNSTGVHATSNSVTEMEAAASNAAAAAAAEAAAQGNSAPSANAVSGPAGYGDSFGGVGSPSSDSSDDGTDSSAGDSGGDGAGGDWRGGVARAFGGAVDPRDYMAGFARGGYDAGGMVSSGLETAGLPGFGANAMAQNQYQQVAQLPVEKLQELAVRIPASTPKGMLIQRALQAKRMTSAQAPAAPQAGMSTGFGGGAMMGQGYGGGGRTGGDGWADRPMPDYWQWDRDATPYGTPIPRSVIDEATKRARLDDDWLRQRHGDFIRANPEIYNGPEGGEQSLRNGVIDPRMFARGGFAGYDDGGVVDPPGGAYLGLPTAPTNPYPDLPPDVMRYLRSAPSFGENDVVPLASRERGTLQPPMNRAVQPEAVESALARLRAERQWNEPVGEPGMSADAEEQAARLNAYQQRYGMGRERLLRRHDLPLPGFADGGDVADFPDWYAHPEASFDGPLVRSGFEPLPVAAPSLKSRTPQSGILGGLNVPYAAAALPASGPAAPRGAPTRAELYPDAVPPGGPYRAPPVDYTTGQPVWRGLPSLESFQGSPESVSLTTGRPVEEIRAERDAKRNAGVDVRDAREMDADRIQSAAAQRAAMAAQAAEAAQAPAPGVSAGPLGRSPIDTSEDNLGGSGLGPLDRPPLPGRKPARPGAPVSNAPSLAQAEPVPADTSMDNLGNSGLGPSALNPPGGVAGLASPGADVPLPGTKPPHAAEPSSGFQPNPWLALAAAGFGMAASRSPYALQAIGEGGLQGLKQYGEQQKTTLSQKHYDNEAKRLSDLAEWHAADLARKTDYANQRHEDRMTTDQRLRDQAAASDARIRELAAETNRLRELSINQRPEGKTAGEREDERRLKSEQIEDAWVKNWYGRNQLLPGSDLPASKQAQFESEYALRFPEKAAARRQALEANRPAPPQGAIDALKNDPSLKDQFEAKFGQGSAAKYLGP